MEELLKSLNGPQHAHAEGGANSPMELFSQTRESVTSMVAPPPGHTRHHVTVIPGPLSLLDFAGASVIAIKVYVKPRKGW